MMAFDIQIDLISFIETKILPQYSKIEIPYLLYDVQKVIARAVDLSRRVGVNVEMAYVIAAYHDLGLKGPRAIHHITGGGILSSDVRLKKWFTDEEIRVMKEAIEDHRASSANVPRSMYGRIIAEADRNLDIKVVFPQIIKSIKQQLQNGTKGQHWLRFVQHLNSKYSLNGYIKIWIVGSDNDKYLQKIRLLLSDRVKLRNEFERYY